MDIWEMVTLLELKIHGELGIKLDKANTLFHVSGYLRLEECSQHIQHSQRSAIRRRYFGTFGTWKHWQWLQVMLDANDARKMRMTHCFIGQDWARLGKTKERRRRQGDKDVFRARLSTNCKRQIEAACCMSLGRTLSLSS